MLDFPKMVLLRPNVDFFLILFKSSKERLANRIFGMRLEWRILFAGSGGLDCRFCFKARGINSCFLRASEGEGTFSFGGCRKRTRR